MFLTDGNRRRRVEITEEIPPGLYRVIVPLSGSPLGVVNSYLITSAEKSLFIDTGMCQVPIEDRTSLLSDNGAGYVS